MIFSTRKGWLPRFTVVLLGGALVPAFLLADEQVPADKSAQTAPQPSDKKDAESNQPVRVNINDYSTFSSALLAAGSGPTRPEENLTEFWIGLTGNPPDEVLRSHLEIPQDRGLLVTNVIEDGPAARAGLKVHDVLLSAGEAPLKEVGDLAKVIGEKKDALLAIRLIRAGKPIIVEVKPERRPPSQTGETCPAISKSKDDEFLRRVYLDLVGTEPDADKVKLFVDDKDANKRSQLANKLLRRSTLAKRSCTACHSAAAEEVKFLDSLIVHWNQPLTSEVLLRDLSVGQFAPYVATEVLTQPGVVINYPDATQAQTHPALPDDLTISITRRGKEPAAIKVTRGADAWGATEKDYTQTLPPEIRVHVEVMLKGSAVPTAPAQNDPRGWKYKFHDSRNGKAGAWSGWTVLDRANKEPAPSQSVTESPLDRAQKQLDALERQISELRKSLGDLKSRPADGVSPPSGEGKK